MAILEQDILSALQDSAGFRCLRTLRVYITENPTLTTSVLLEILGGSGDLLRSRSARALSLLADKNIPEVERALCAHLMSDPDPRLRLSCAIGLMSSNTSQVRDAYIHALDDESEKVALVACMQLGHRSDEEVPPPLFQVLSHPSWKMRLQACKSLIKLKAADHRVVAALEKLAHEPEAEEHDAQNEEFQRITREAESQHPDEPPTELWGKVETILAQARQQAKKNES